MKQDKILQKNKDPYFKKTVKLRFRGKELKLETSQALFSSHDIDLGTKHLLRTIENKNLSNYHKILDLGAGYGPIGIAIKAECPASEIHMVDKDALALEYSRTNEKLNNVSGIKIYGSLGYSDIDERDFDLIISNIPAKVGNEVLSHMLLDARKHLKPGGEVFIVVIEAIYDIVSEILQDPAVKINFQKKWPGHSVFHYEFTDQPTIKSPSADMDLYTRSIVELNVGGKPISIKTTYNLPEFDTLSFESSMLINEIKNFRDRELNSSLFFNTGQGFIPVIFSRLLELNSIFLIDRDLQALRITEENLILNGFDRSKLKSSFQVGIKGESIASVNLIAGIMSDKDSKEVNAMLFAQASNLLEQNDHLVLSSSSTVITRIESLAKKEGKLKLIKRSKDKGKSSIVFTKM